jgi:uracil-DNA glycosylase family 4
LNKEPNDPGAPVPGIGALPAKIMLLGEAPGADESKPSGFFIGKVPTGRPFIGKAGKGLKNILQELGYSFENTYITNAVKHRPPGNRNPTPAELSACTKHILETEIALVGPKVIVCLGRVPASAMASLAGHTLPLSSIRGYSFQYKNIQVECTWHPAFACGYNKSAEPQLRADLESVLQRYE